MSAGDAKRILIVEDDPDIADMLGINLLDEGFVVERAADGETARTLLRGQRYDLLLLDIMLPGISGLDLCREVRAGGEYVPIIVISARGAESQRIVGLELGADDYIAKPFSVLELIARIRALFRREAAHDKSMQQVAGVVGQGGLAIDALRREVRLDDAPVVLTAREFDLLLHFARHPGQVFSRYQLLDQVWGLNHEGYEHTVNTHINRLRNKIERDPAHPDCILTVWGVGYKFAFPDSGSAHRAA